MNPTERYGGIPVLVWKVRAAACSKIQMSRIKIYQKGASAIIPDRIIQCYREETFADSRSLTFQQWSLSSMFFVSNYMVFLSAP